MLLWKFLRLRNSAWDFLWVNFWPRDFWGFCWNPWGFFWLFYFSPIQSSPFLEFWSMPPPPPGKKPGVTSIKLARFSLKLPFICLCL